MASLGMQLKASVPMIKAIRGELTFALVGFVLGVLAGWFVLGWGIAPGQWTSGAPVDLQKSYRDFHLRVLSIALGDKAVTLEEMQKLGLGVDVKDARWTLDGVLKDLGELAKDPQTGLRYRPLIDTLEALQRQPPAESPGATPAPGISLGPIILAILAIVVVGFVSLQLVRRVSQSAQRQAVPGPVAGVPLSRAQAAARTMPAMVWAGETEAPLRQFDLTYVLGDDHFDMSNAVETGEGMFLGECGMGISERIGVGSPDKVSALEVWLFDKNDIRTVTKVLMSEHAYTDRATRDKLTAKGEPVLAEEGLVITLETASLRVRARVSGLEYGSGALPENSFFQKVHVTMAAWQLADSGVTQPAVSIN